MRCATRYLIMVADLGGSGGSGGSATPVLGRQVAVPCVVQVIAPVALAGRAVDLHVNRRDAVGPEQPGHVAGAQLLAAVVTPWRLADLAQRREARLGVQRGGIPEHVLEGGA